MIRKNYFLLSIITFSILFFMNSCAKDQSLIHGKITYVDTEDNQEHNANGAVVYLMPEGTTSTDDALKKTTTADDGTYSFYPVPDGDYYIYAEYLKLSQLHLYSGKSATFTAKWKKTLEIDVVLK